MGGRAVCRREVEGGSPLSAQLHVVSGAQEQGFNFIAVWKVRRRTSQHVSHLGPTFRDCAADTLGKAVHLSPRAFRQHVLTLPSPPPPVCCPVPTAWANPSEKGPMCREHSHLTPLQCGQERGVYGHSNRDFCRSFGGASET